MSHTSIEPSSESTNLPIECHCECGKSRFRLNATPQLRFCCHCKICQQVYKKPYSDFTILKAKDVELPKLNGIQFKRHKSLFAVDRGQCPSCGLPALSWFKHVTGLHVAMIPSANIPKTLSLPTPSAHIFYENRIQDAEDEFPKVTGYLKSEWCVFKAILSTLR